MENKERVKKYHKLEETKKMGQLNIDDVLSLKKLVSGKIDVI